MNELTNDEKNLLKDVLSHLANSKKLTREFANQCNFSVSKFNKMADVIYTKLGNGRLIVETSDWTSKEVNNMVSKQD